MSSLLSNLLPGFRELRAPLAAGYIWLLALYLAIEPHVPDAEDADGLYATLLHLRDEASSVGLAVAVGFAAYLVGSLSEGALGALWQEDRVGLAGSFLWTAPYTSKGKQALEAELSARMNEISDLVGSGWIERFVVEPGDGSVPWAPDELSGLVRDYRESSMPYPDSADPTIAFFLYRAWADPKFDDEWLHRPAKPDDRMAAASVHRFLQDRVVREFRLMRTRLIGEEPELFSIVDRLQSEAEFRFAIVPPLAALAVATATRLGQWYEVLAVLVLSTLALWTLWRQGVLRLRQSGDQLLDTLSLRRVASPTLERLDALVAAVNNERQERQERAR
jgi:hypothetical protein